MKGGPQKKADHPETVITLQDYWHEHEGGLPPDRMYQTYVPQGSVFDVEQAGNGWYGGVWSSPNGTFYIEIPVELCEEYEGGVDIMAEYWNQKYAEEFAKDKKGEIPFMCLHFMIRDTEEQLSKAKEWEQNTHTRQRYTRWLDALHAYRQKHYANVEP